MAKRRLVSEKAKTHFAKLLARVEKGRQVLISRPGKPVARLVPHEERPRAPVFGADRGAFVVPEDFDAALPDHVLARSRVRDRWRS